MRLILRDRSGNRRIPRSTIHLNTPGIEAVSGSVAFLKLSKALALVRAGWDFTIFLTTDTTLLRRAVVPDIAGVAFDFNTGGNVRG